MMCFIIYNEHGRAVGCYLPMFEAEGWELVDELHSAQTSAEAAGSREACREIESFGNSVEAVRF